LYLARKEHCLALGTQLKTKFKITDYKVYRVFPNGEVQFLHPADGVFPEKVNAGRGQVNTVMRKIGDNPNPATIKFSSKKAYD
jgi:photosystem I subunit II